MGSKGTSWISITNATDLIPGSRRSLATLVANLEADGDSRVREVTKQGGKQRQLRSDLVIELAIDRADQADAVFVRRSSLDSVQRELAVQGIELAEARLEIEDYRRLEMTNLRRENERLTRQVKSLGSTVAVLTGVSIAPAPDS